MLGRELFWFTVPRARIELATRGFSVHCSTTELPRHTHCPARLGRAMLHCGPDRTRTRHPRRAKAMLYQMSYWPSCMYRKIIAAAPLNVKRWMRLPSPFACLDKIANTQYSQPARTRRCDNARTPPRLVVASSCSERFFIFRQKNIQNKTPPANGWCFEPMQYK